MKRILLVSFALFLLQAPTVEAQITLIGSGVAAGSGDANNVTTGAYDTTGADLITCHIAYFDGTAITFSDSQSNVWTPLTERNHSGVLFERTFYVVSPSTNAAHTFSVTSSGLAPSIGCLAWNNTHNSAPFEAETFNLTLAAETTVQPGAIAPADDGDVFITMLSGSADYLSASIDSGYTLQLSVPWSVFNARLDIAYLIQATAASSNPTWTIPVADFLLTTNTAFKEFVMGGGGGGGGGGRRTLRGVGQ